MDWPAWMAVSFLFSLYAVWARGKPKALLFLPWVFLALWFGNFTAQYIISGWGSIFYARRIWLKGALALALVALLPVATGLAAEALVVKRAQSRRLRFLLVLLVSLAAAFLLAHPVAAVVQGGFEPGWWY